MAHRSDVEQEPDQAKVYQIRIKGRLTADWSDWFGQLHITQEENGETLLVGPLIDQAELFGLLRKVRDLGLPLLSVTTQLPDAPDTPPSEPDVARKEDHVPCP